MRKISNKIILYGASGHGRDILDAAEVSGMKILGFVDDNPAIHNTLINGKKVLGGFEWLKYNNDVRVLLSIGIPKIKKNISDMISNIGILIAPPIIHPNAYLSKEALIKNGSVILAFSSIQPQVEIGEHVYISTLSTLGHDVIIEDFVSLHPGVQIGGETVIKKGCFIGMGAKILPRLKIGEWSTVGAGAVVVKDVPDHVTVVGVPAKIINDS